MGSRLLTVALAVFAAGLVAVVVAIDRYDDAYSWVAHTSDVRLVIGRAVGHLGSSSSCVLLRDDLDGFAQLTADNPVQQGRVPALRESIERVCAQQPAPQLLDQLAQLDATERQLMAERRDDLERSRRWSILMFALSGSERSPR